MKKILILNYEFPPLGGGGGIASYKIAKGFIQNGYEVDCITSHYKGLKSFEIVEGIHVYRIKVFGRTSIQTSTILSLISFPFFSLWRGIILCMKNKYEFIHTHFVLPTGPLGFLLSKIFSIRNILSMYGVDIYDPTQKSSSHRHWYFRKIVRFLLNHADEVVAESCEIKEKCLEYYKPNKEIKIIPLPYDITSFVKVSRADLGLDENKKYIIGIGRLVKRKGFDTFIKALALLDNSVNGIIIGDGPELINLKALAQEFGVSERLNFVGQVDEDKKFQYLSNADVFVLSSIHEGFGIVLQEAMQVGLPIVATSEGGQVDIVRDGHNGFLVPVSNEKFLADKIDSILNSKEISTKMKINNLNDIQRFSTKIIVKEFFDTLIVNKNDK